MRTVLLEGQPITPSKIVCIGRNYVEHIHELGNAIPEQMVVFNKPNASISPQLYAHHQYEQLHYEGELSFIVKNSQLAAIGVGLDLTKRSLQSALKSKQLPWERAKAFDGSAVFSRFISLNGLDINQLSIEVYINCVRVQCGHVEQMLYSPQVILEEVLAYTTLEDGDILMTGTPKGVGTVEVGDVFMLRLKHADQILLETEWHAE